MQIEQQTVVVTGGASGLGLACAELFRKQGAKVMVWDKAPREAAGYLQCDVQDEVSVLAALETTQHQMGTPRICIQCAGIAPARRMVSREGVMPLESFRQVINVNLIGTFNVMRLVAEAMSQLPVSNEEGERGVFINTASVAAYEGQIGQSAYSASKGGIVSMTLPLARELASLGIRVNTIAPGMMATPLALGMPADVQEKLQASIPFPKRFGYPHEFAALAAHIVENCLLNGEVIRLDGALRMPAK